MKKSKGNTRYKRPRREIMVVAILMFIFFTPLISSFGFDNKLYYENNDMKVEIKDCSLWLFTCLIDGETLGTVELKSHTSVDEVLEFGYGAEEVVMYYDNVDLYGESLGEVTFIDKRTDKEIEKDYYFVEWGKITVPTYEDICSRYENKTIIDCIAVENGTKQIDGWVALKDNIIPNRNTRIGLKTYVAKDDYIDAVWTIAGKEITKHAEWTASLEVGIVAWWKLDEASGAVIDSVNFLHNGTNTDATPNEAGLIGTSYRFDTSGVDKIVIPDDNAFTPAKFTISGWINFSTLASTYHPILIKYQDGSALRSWFIMARDDAKVWAGLGVGGAHKSITTVGTVPDDGEFHHVAFTYNQTHMCVFIDTVIECVTETGTNNNDDQDVGIGNNNADGTNSDAFIDEVGFWNRSLSIAEITDLFNGGAGITYRGPPDAAPTITLDDPPNNTVFTTNEISFNCTGSDDQNLVNVSLILDGEVNETNTPANNTLTNFDKIVSIEEHNWTCRAADNNSQVTTADTEFFDINISVGTELIAPIDVQNFTITEVSFLINSTPINQDLVSVNMTVWFNNGTVALTNSSDLSGSVEVQTNLTSTLQEAPYIWGAETFGTLTSNVTDNQTFEVHMTPLVVIINEPKGLFDSVIESSTFNLSWNIEEDGQNLSAHVTNCSFTYNGVQTYLPNISVCVETNSTTFTYITGINSLVFTAEDAFGFVTNETTTWGVVLFKNSDTFNTTSYETELNNFTINVTWNSSNWDSIVGNLIYNSTTNLGTKSGTGNTLIFSETIARLFTPPHVKPFYWNFRLTNSTGTFGFNTTSQNQTEQPILFINCNATAETRYLNISFKDEGNLSTLNASIPTATLIHTLGNFDVSKTLTYINNTENDTFAFCLDPPNRTLHVSSTFQYTSGGYQQRVIESNDTFTSSVTDTILFLLANANGLFVTFQVINIAEQSLADVLINASRIIDGVSTIVGTGLTNDAGAKTFWLNPNFLHTILAFKTGFSQFSTSLFPDQTSYTINLGGGAIPEEQDYTKGITTDVFPKGSLLDNDTIIVFNLTLVSTFWDVSEFGFVLKDASDNVFDVQTDSSNGGTVTTNLNTLSNTSIIMEYFWVIEGNFTNATRSWIIFDDTTDDSWSIKVFFTDLLAFIDDGMFGLDNFGLALITFLTIFIFTGIVSLRFGISSPSAVVTLLFSLVLFFDVGLGLMENLNPVGAVPFFPTILMGLILTGVLLKDGIR
ncbi:hypothetical protein LCGC14_0990600 [marine sediment metagenome]|uniref:LamG-like jellyroll fold domain-containing protein n=1 Tax=marine sediment metagenome TaxID=412755 RepID=A0A0F9N5T9_9ZZZZ